MRPAQQRFLAVMTALAVLALAVQALSRIDELALFLTPLFLLAGLLLSGRFVGEELIARRYAAARRRPPRPPHRPRWRPRAVLVPVAGLRRTPLSRRGPPLVLPAAA